ncbi:MULTISPECIES: ZIP family metal transporter [Paraburkholderia]|uniref:ZIP family metal transporter n=1 Tax=Paraburkholderia TaxID=1822464 RepID=UPI0038B8565C
MTPAVKLALFTLPPLIAAGAGAFVASVKTPGARTTSVIQHFTGGIVFAAAALELLPQDRTHTTTPVVIGFILGLMLMLGIRQMCSRLERRFENSSLPTGLIVVTAIDLIVDGLVLGIAFSAGEETGLILTIALTLEVLFLALSVSTALGAARVRRLWTLGVPVLLAALLSLSAVGGHALFSGLPPNFYAVLLGLGTVALIYLVTEELLVEAHEVPETAVATSAFFVGFIVFFIIEASVKTG